MTESTATPASTPVVTPVIVVGVGPEEVESALAFAAEEAIRARCGLHLVHAVHVSSPGPENALLTAVDVEKWGREVLDLAVKRAEDLVDGAVPVTHELHRGAPVHVLVEAGRSARMVVLEHRHLSRLSRIVNRTVAGGVAARLPVPVVAVPSGWTPTDGPKVVVAGVDVPERSDEVLRTAVAEAHARGASLKVVHAWSWPAYDAEATSYNDERQRWSDRSRAEVRAGCPTGWATSRWRWRPTSRCTPVASSRRFWLPPRARTCWSSGATTPSCRSDRTSDRWPGPCCARPRAPCCSRTRDRTGRSTTPEGLRRPGRLGIPGQPGIPEVVRLCKA